MGKVMKYMYICDSKSNIRKSKLRLIEKLDGADNFKENM